MHAVNRKYTLLTLLNWKSKLTGANDIHVYFRVVTALLHSEVALFPVVRVRDPNIAMKVRRQFPKYSSAKQDFSFRFEYVAILTTHVE